MAKESIRPLPDFLGIGTQRSGSTWLYKHLSMHPGIWMPPIKELHYFNRLEDAVLKRDMKKWSKDLRKRLITYRYLRASQTPLLWNIRWDLNYFLGYPDLQWYSSLFTPGMDKVAGEITPAYMTLSRDVVQGIHAHNPGLKIIFFMRDPIDRVWSSAIKGLAKLRQRDARGIPEKEFLRHIQGRSSVLRTDYMRTLSIWESIFPAEQIHIGFYDDIEENPQGALLQVLRFLGVDEDLSYISDDLHRKVGSTEKFKIPIPKALEARIAAKYVDQLEALSDRFGGHTARWLARARGILESSDFPS